MFKQQVYKTQLKYLKTSTLCFDKKVVFEPKLNKSSQKAKQQGFHVSKCKNLCKVYLYINMSKSDTPSLSIL